MTFFMEKIMQNKSSYISTVHDDFVTERVWEWMISGNLPGSFTIDDVLWILKQWRLKVSMRTGLSLAVDPILVNNHGLHLHALMLGRNYSQRKTLLDVSIYDREGIRNDWAAVIEKHPSNKVKKQYNLDITLTWDKGAISYLQCQKNMPLSKRYEQLPLYVPDQIKRRKNLSRLIGRSVVTDRSRFH